MLSATTPSMRRNAINENASVAVITAAPNRRSLEFLTRQDHSQGGADQRGGAGGYARIFLTKNAFCTNSS
jgi:hypothetical protein